MGTFIGRGGGHQRAAHAAGQFGHAGETRGVLPRAASGLDDEIVASDFALQIDAARDPAHNWMQREQGFEKAIDNQRVVVTASQVGASCRPTRSSSPSCSSLKSLTGISIEGRPSPATMGAGIPAEAARRTCLRPDPHCASHASTRAARCGGTSPARAFRPRSIRQLMARRRSMTTVTTIHARTIRGGHRPAGIASGNRSRRDGARVAAGAMALGTDASSWLTSLGPGGDRYRGQIYLLGGRLRHAMGQVASRQQDRDRQRRPPHHVARSRIQRPARNCQQAEPDRRRHHRAHQRAVHQGSQHGVHGRSSSIRFRRRASSRAPIFRRSIRLSMSSSGESSKKRRSRWVMALSRASSRRTTGR